MEKSVKLAVGIYLAIILIICSIYLAFILIGSLNGKDMSNSVLDTDHSRINNTSRNSNEDVTSSNNESNNTKAHSFANSEYKAININEAFKNNKQIKKSEFELSILLITRVRFILGIHNYNLSLSIHISFDYNSFVTMIFLSCSKKR